MNCCVLTNQASTFACFHFLLSCLIAILVSYLCNSISFKKRSMAWHGRAEIVKPPHIEAWWSKNSIKERLGKLNQEDSSAQLNKGINQDTVWAGSIGQGVQCEFVSQLLEIIKCTISLCLHAKWVCIHILQSTKKASSLHACTWKHRQGLSLSLSLYISLLSPS